MCVHQLLACQFQSVYNNRLPISWGNAICSAGQVQPPSQQATRHARRIYVGGLPPTANEQNIATFFSNALAAVGGTTAGPGQCLPALLLPLTLYHCLCLQLHTGKGRLSCSA